MDGASAVRAALLHGPLSSAEPARSDDACHAVALGHSQLRHAVQDLGADLYCLSLNLTGPAPCYRAGKEAPRILRRARRQVTLDQRAEIVRRNRIERTPGSTRCDEYDLQPRLFCTWLKPALENLPSAPAPRANEVDPRARELAAENAALKARSAKKLANAVRKGQ